MCAIRCPAEIVQYHVAQLARRMYGRYGLKPEPNIAQKVEEVRGGTFTEDFEQLLAMDADQLKDVYIKRQQAKEVY